MDYTKINFKNEKQKELFYKIINNYEIKASDIYYNKFNKLIVNCENFTYSYFKWLTKDITKNDFIAIEKQKQKIIFL